jgi:hypothetical protein
VSDDMKYYATRFKDTVSIDVQSAGSNSVTTTLHLTPAQAVELAKALLGAADWVDTERTPSEE